MTNFAIKAMSFALPFSIAAIGLASAANASYAPDPSADASGTSSVQASAAATPKKAEKQHCMMIEVDTGSRMSRRTCKTIAQWEALGYEVKSTR